MKKRSVIIILTIVILVLGGASFGIYKFIKNNIEKQKQEETRQESLIRSRNQAEAALQAAELSYQEMAHIVDEMEAQCNEKVIELEQSTTS